jgi:hypothetical protein
MQSIGEVTTMFPIAGGFIEVGLYTRWCGGMDADENFQACRKIRRSCIQFFYGLDVLFHVERVPWKW